MLQEYTGNLRGGPDAGNYVTATTKHIKVVSSIEMWLDGEEEDKNVNLAITRGVYTWQQEQGYFTWEMHDSTFYTRKRDSTF